MQFYAIKHFVKSLILQVLTPEFILKTVQRFYEFIFDKNNSTGYFYFTKFEADSSFYLS